MILDLIIHGKFRLPNLKPIYIPEFNIKLAEEEIEEHAEMLQSIVLEHIREVE